MFSGKEIILCTDTAPSFLGIFDFSIAPTLLFYAYIPIVIISLALGLIIYFSESGSSLKNKLFFLLTVIFSLHIINEILQWIVVPAGIIYFAWSISLLLRTLILFITLYFVHAFITSKDFGPKAKHTLYALMAPIVLLLPTTLNVTGFDLDYCNAVDGPLWSYLYVLQILAIITLFFLSFVQLVKYIKFRKPFILQAFYLLIGTSLFLSIFFGSEFFGDITAAYEINLFGPIGMLLFLSAISYIIVRFRAFRIRIIGAQALVVTLWLLVGSLIFVEKSFAPRIISLITLFFTTIAGFFLIRSIKKEASQKEQLEILTDRLEVANEKLKELDKAKSEFVSIASHQLRSPLTAIRGYASMLAEGSFGQMPVKAQESAKRIEESAKLMAMSIEDYLNVSRIESGNMKYNLSDFNVVEMTSKLCDDLRPEALKRSLILLFRSDVKSKGVVNADIGKTNQIIHNLINNSIKYTQKGSISVFVHDDIKTKRLYIDIIDTGIGMSPETISKLFGKFSRADNANSVNTSGTGLGLYVALKMAQQMGGHISCTSEGDGKGSTFTFELPLAM